MMTATRHWALGAIEVDVGHDVTDIGQASIDRTITVPAKVTPVTLAVRAVIHALTMMRTTPVASRTHPVS